MIAKIALSLQYYGEAGRFILFISTILVLMYIIFTLIRWVHTLSQLGSLGDALSKIEKVAKQSLAMWRFQPDLGANHSQPNPNDQENLVIYAKRTGYLFDLDLACLQSLSEQYDVHVHINERPGKFLSPKSASLKVFNGKDLTEETEQELHDKLYSAITIDKSRSYNQDPRFGLLVMSEVGQRAMSAAVNDPATAIAVSNSLTHILVDTKAVEDMPEQDFNRLSITPLDEQDMIESVFAPIARDSVNNLEINQRLLKSLSIIYHHVPEQSLRNAALVQAKELIERCIHQFEFEQDRARLQKTFDESFTQ